ncbi:hypothetical protein MPTK1_6g15800 [Marchantia polymorpha subsp. ruderalis]|uniref:Uncharacterized protein n=2 Tax=Marchantia polymorpha TaxID=3197 RepID=A0AAF6BSH4_MARPO|nr:hypothetical protein MARPO_0056s0092 [Marchantia polymorpha]BBN14958.1 hypothetical protein Mp_6g15800 [Marchantia polymorpha subsp. ruderalis]|eukprot:PTQ37642.1 hypothetical protein MARPO_0056s0092 [Marchantia polymorpha]
MIDSRRGASAPTHALPSTPTAFLGCDLAHLSFPLGHIDLRCVRGRELTLARARASASAGAVGRLRRSG